MHHPLSITVHGITQHLPPPRKATDPLQPADHYTQQKVKAESLVRDSGLMWSIFRIGVVLPVSTIDGDSLKSLFIVPLDTRMEFVHTKDVGRAFANGLTAPDVWGKTLLIGGGKDWQTTYREMTSAVLGSYGINLPPDAAFTTEPYYTDWLDTSESQRLLDYQHHRYADLIDDMRKSSRYFRPFVQLLNPFIQRWLLAKSPFYRRS
jgi:UDP-glucose 4-epimerase